MLNFISMGIASGIYSKVIDLGATTQWNPVNPYAAAFVYSNIYLVLAALHALIFLFYYFRFGKTRSSGLQANS